MPTKTEPRVCEQCGQTFSAEPYRIKKGLAKFCSHSCSTKARKHKHGHTTHTTQSGTYTTYMNMLGRCHRPGHSKYKSYGAIGIQVCQRWQDSFANFLDDMGERPVGMTLDRVDGCLGYFKENCRWATPKMQQSNIRTNVNLTFMGKTQNISAWAEELGLDKGNLAWRIRSGWTIESALSTPPKHGNRTVKTRQVLYEYCGKTQCISEWAREYGLSNSLLRLRLSRGWGIERSLTEPKGKFVMRGDHLANP